MHLIRSRYSTRSRYFTRSGHILPYAWSVLILFSLGLCFSCQEQPIAENPDTSQQTTRRHLDEKRLIVALESNSTDYFLYQGQPMGYHLEILQELAHHMGCQLEIIHGNSLTEQLDLLKTGKVDIIASNLNITPSRERFIEFSHPLYHTRQVLVQLKPDYLSDTASYITRVEQLQDKIVYVRHNSVFENTLKKLNRDYPRWNHIHIERSEETEEELLFQVSRGEIAYTIASESKASRFAQTHPQMDCHLPLSEPEPIGWAMRLYDDSLHLLVNQWIDSLSGTQDFKYLYHKYYELPFHKTVLSVESGFKKMDSVSDTRKREQWEMLVKEGLVDASDTSYMDQTYKRKHTGKKTKMSNLAITPFDPLLKKYSREIGWDWRLLASLIYQESQFQSHLVSKQGAIGLMQMMPSTARTYHITVRSSEEDQIKAGVAYIASLYKSLKKNIGDSIAPSEMVYFVLASYNTGPGHVLDARRLALKYGADPNVWYGNVETYMGLKSDPKYYKDPECRNGYARGKETVDFVRKIDRRYMHYCNLVDR